MVCSDSTLQNLNKLSQQQTHNKQKKKSRKNFWVHIFFISPKNFCVIFFENEKSQAPFLFSQFGLPVADQRQRIKEVKQ